MSVLSIAQDILVVVKMVHVITQQIKGNKNKALRMANRINSIVPTLMIIIQDPDKALCTPDRLADLLSYITDMKKFLEKFNNSCYFGKAFTIGSDDKAFLELNEGFTSRLDALQFNITVNAEKQRQEDAQDTAADHEQLKSLVEQVLLSQGMMKDEITNHLNYMQYQTQTALNETKDAVIQSNAEIMSCLAAIKQGNLSNVPPIRTITHDQLEYDDQDENSKLGEGGFGSIVRGSYMGLHVAIKMIKYAKITREMKDELRKEALTMQMLDFPGIIHFYGAQLETAPRFIVMELAMCSLFDLLYNQEKFAPGVNLTVNLRIRILADIAMSLEYIHSLSIIHRDIKTHNILISSDFKPKITDFGLSKSKTTSDASGQSVSADYNSSGTAGYTGTPAYLAPEIYRESSYTKYSDVYAYSVLMNEVLTRQVPFRHLSPMDIMICVAQNSADSPSGVNMSLNNGSNRPALFSSTDVTDDDAVEQSVVNEIQTLISKGWGDAAGSRPQFHVIAKTLNRLAGSGGGDSPLRLNNTYSSSQNQNQGLDSMGNSPTKRNSSRRAENATPSTAGANSKEAVALELSSWLTDTVELFPESSQSYAKLMVASGVTSLKKLSQRVNTSPSFLVSIGIAEYEANDITTALERLHLTVSGGDEGRVKRVSTEGTALGSITSSAALLPNLPRPSEVPKFIDVKYERKLMLRARDCKDVASIITVLSEVLQLEPLSHVNKETLQACFSTVSTLCFNNVVNQTELGKGGACVLVATLLHSYFSTVIAPGSGGGVDCPTFEQGLWSMTGLANSNPANQAILGEADACPLVIGILKNYGAQYPSITEQGLRSVENLSIDATNREKFGQIGAPAVLVSLLSTYYNTNNSIVEHCLAAVVNLCRMSPENQLKFGRANLCEVLVRVLLASGNRVVSVADYALYTVRAITLNCPENVSLFAKTDIVDVMLEALSVHGSGSMTVAESGLSALSLLCGNNAHVHTLYFSNSGYALLVNLFQMYGRESKVIATHGVTIYNALLCYMTSSGSNGQSVSLSPTYTSPQATREIVTLLVTMLRAHGAAHATVTEQCTVALTKLVSIAVTMGSSDIYLLYSELQLHTTIAESLHAKKITSNIVELSFNLLLALCNFPDNIVKLTSGHHIPLYKFILQLLAVHASTTVSSVKVNAFLVTGIRLFTTLMSRLPAVEANNGDQNSCNYLLTLLTSVYNSVTNSHQTYGEEVEAGLQQSALSLLHTTVIAVQYLTVYNANKVTLGEMGACKLLTDITRSFGSTDQTFAENCLEIVANMSTVTDNEGRLAREGCCKLVVDLLIQYAYASQNATEQGLRAMSNLAVGNKSMLGELNACAIVVDIVRYYITSNGQHNDAIACQASITTYNLAFRHEDNKRAFIVLGFENDLQAMLSDRQLSQKARDEIKDAIGAVRY